jgi:integrase
LLQAALAIDIPIHVPLCMENLGALSFDQHLHWPHGRGKPALIVLRGDETKNNYPLEFELPTTIAEIAPDITGRRPDALFLTWAGDPAKQDAVTDRIEKAVRKHLGVKLTPHQVRHLAAKIILDANPGAYELVRQMLGHKNMKKWSDAIIRKSQARAVTARASSLQAKSPPVETTA